MKLFLHAVTPLFLFAALVPSSSSQTVFVDANLSTGANDGTSWTDAYQGPLGLQVALTNSPVDHRIFAADGTYHPAPPGGARTATFTISDERRIYGGFLGGEANIFERPAPGVAPSILSGDLEENDAPNGQGRDDNSFHVLTIQNGESPGVVNGFTISGGNADGSSALNQHLGGGMIVVGGYVRLEDCRFERNRSAFAGGAGSIDGPGFFPFRFYYLRSCVFEDNDGGTFGGALSIRGGSGRMDNCTFTRNRALRGGALELFGSTQSALISCHFAGNEAGSFGGGALWIGNGGSTEIHNGTVADNTSSGMSGSGILVSGANVSLRSAILWGNEGASGSQTAASQISGVAPGDLSFSIVEGMTNASTSVIDVDPNFVDPSSDDYRLSPGSPAIDAGFNSGFFTLLLDLDAGRQRRLVNDPATANTGMGGSILVDLGAFEFSAGALGTIICSTNTSSNSQGSYGAIDAYGSSVAATNTFTLTASRLPPNQFGFFLVSRSLGFDFPGTSDGILCLGGNIGRIIGPGQITSSGPTGSLSVMLDLTAIPTPLGFVAAQPGDSWSFQAWHRDATSNGSNLTDATTVTFE